MLLVEIGKRDETFVEYQAALELQKKLAKQFPDASAYQAGLADTHNSMGLLLAQLGKRDQARLEYVAANATRKKLAERFPAIARYQIDLGGGYCNYGNLLCEVGKSAESLECFNDAVRILQQCVEKDPTDWTAKQYLKNSHCARAQAYDQFRKYSDAVNEWGLAIDLSPASEQASLRGKRATSRFQAGAYAEAMAEFDELTKSSDWTADQWYCFASVYALASDKIANKRKEYAGRAMELLHNAVAAGFDQAASMAKDTNLDSLRDREDFKKLVNSLPKSPAPAKP